MSSEKASSKSTPEAPWPVREVNTQVKQWIERLGHLWVEGQLAQINVKPNWKLSYLTLRDVEQEMSVQLTCPTDIIRNRPTPLKDGDRVIVYGKPAFYAGRGTFSLWVTDIRPVGIGELLARIEELRKRLAAEGLFDPARKKRLPFLPNRVGLITGRGSAAERDVLSVAKDRWPEVQFEVINTAVQGASAVPEIIEALRVLDQDPRVDVIIIARGGGSVEDLLPFSEEALQRAVAAAQTPVVSAIGHEPDTPVLDNVADLRAATPTDAAKRVVPDVAEERMLINQLRSRSAAALRGWVQREQQALAAIRTRPVLADPMTPINRRRDEIAQAVGLIRRDVTHLVRTEQALVASLRAQVSALGPSATLARGYSVVQVIPRDGSAPEVVTTIEQSPPGSQLRIRVADGSITAASMGTQQAN
ncbi:exodeoxyribonuclease VII, large subunit [Corynebacterium glutamicum MB001]|uniref:Exodeoxyribonuclease 7 large subunit n=1 Tax=Corynebacterium glutamicum (strain ATCC 13032 / DSM 20300 / JCM 1318 / BCRC 11384 / CCUG 27702 / LMG 3730 / NBRC 12168 / NCIMB 10025 / NRRL B-2784 / 534) TaxID=196627 RepID=EX7L_CORGL|nr:exodeoxyribonuclease VII large subunit [Corynebacterium glutamicum]Q8NRM3.1 RecName: Full=Exodeoxyribonuclease 7 large subunit; AltName: Full=Exodeoxyribonuclease VII large subunit; Short=Exonuclease VII large subunit [Corynebacterium glutamicum ATCC 13032]AGT05018.1 exodeoxyribonuclease VII, large subunit [Corynebacterium glutamicum MB001]ARV64808.1 exodeoxyribonuclease VII large subunit [Corynebacterium glutamicum]ASW13713.1 exodeoxyribonuclease VII, large subunit [Corynebacterium glutamic